MELALVLKELWTRKRLLALGLALSAFGALIAVDRVQLLPPKLTPRSLVYASASTKAYVDAPQSFMSNLVSNPGNLVYRAVVYANVLPSPGMVDLIGHYAGIPGDEIFAAGPIDPNEQRVVVEPTALQRNQEVAGENAPYQLQFTADPDLPTIGIYAQAPTVAQADALANASVTALQHYITALEVSQHVLAQNRAVIRQVGPPFGTVVDASFKKKIAALVFLAVLMAWCVLTLIGARVVHRWRTADVPQLSPRHIPPEPGVPGLARPARGHNSAGPMVSRPSTGAGRGSMDHEHAVW